MYIAVTCVVMLEIGQWLMVNGEAIYGPRPWTVFGEGATKVVKVLSPSGIAGTSPQKTFASRRAVIRSILLCWTGHKVVSSR